MKRVAYICSDPGVPVFGCKGSSIHVQEIIRAMIKKNLSVDVFARRLEGVPQRDLKMVTYHALPKLTQQNPIKREYEAIHSNRHLFSVLEAKGPFGLIYERHALWSVSAMAYANKCGVPGILEVNAPLVEEQKKYRTLVNEKKALEMSQNVFEKASTLIAVSNEVGRYLSQFPCHDGKTHVIPNGVNVRRFSPRRASASKSVSKTFTVGFVGTLKPWHGLKTLINAFEQFREKHHSCRLLIIGDGPERATLMKQLDDMNIANAVEFTGQVSPADIPKWLSVMDVAVAPYPKLGNFYFSPLKVYEYMAASLPVIASRVGQLETLIADGVNGILVPPDNMDALVEAITCLAQDRALRIRLGAAARETVSKAHTWDAVLERILIVAEVNNGTVTKSTIQKDSPGATR